ncbi:MULTISPECIES: 1,6-anhydro-N-acetylmuramyl-L-alanine amidase AmpD [Gammaproteobacteria]|uniref:1,6-anhydro-N-acetylmuramyl-L-alanine amidase AmpD n=1 Tax=Gammaproteobacteria TaxID=1236 RepID=UPI000DD0BC0E|nr:MULTISPECIES: 1,6-anhydro-N-acetylmuramyl-L-alanine amidase AmpD [Gammaproteobacteria]RTE86302.1 1,6-anhydro-N-acetylmuramyl-L-alanine amidase AmpD [Aliidiomarina sp. B3213]TCZ91653.1 1,6-anhydro-N-acetylmuramyl-L-alanine amidase AmpD [Lysobacter sp. N42]
MKIQQHVVKEGVFRASPHADERPDSNDISLLVIHGISLPAGQFGGPYIDDLFMGCLDCKADSSFGELEGLRVSAHCLVRRNGEVIQYVPFDRRAWHAGRSAFKGRERCNDFSIGIELEGTDTTPYTDLQYEKLAELAAAIMLDYPDITLDRIVGHEHIAPGRKTDPGEAFNWSRFIDEVRQCVKRTTE